MITLQYRKIGTFLDEIPLTKMSRIALEEECRLVIDTIKKILQLGYKSNGDIGSGLKTISLRELRITLSNNKTEVSLTTFLIHLGYPYLSAVTIIRTMVGPTTTVGKRVLTELKRDCPC